MHPTGFEPAAFGVGVQRAIHLRHERLYTKNVVKTYFKPLKSSISNSGQFVVCLPLTTAFLQVQITLYRTKMSLKPTMSQLSENYDRTV